MKSHRGNSVFPTGERTVPAVPQCTSPPSAVHPPPTVNRAAGSVFLLLLLCSVPRGADVFIRLSGGKKKRPQLRQLPRAARTPRFHGTPSGGARGSPISKTPATCFRQPVCDARRQTHPCHRARGTRGTRFSHRAGERPFGTPRVNLRCLVIAYLQCGGLNGDSGSFFRLFSCSLARLLSWM